MSAVLVELEVTLRGEAVELAKVEISRMNWLLMVAPVERVFSPKVKAEVVAAVRDQFQVWRKAPLLMVLLAVATVIEERAGEPPPAVSQEK